MKKKVIYVPGQLLPHVDDVKFKATPISVLVVPALTAPMMAMMIAESKSDVNILMLVNFNFNFNFEIEM